MYYTDAQIWAIHQARIAELHARAASRSRRKHSRVDSPPPKRSSRKVLTPVPTVQPLHTH